jgi:hypothetical protein
MLHSDYSLPVTALLAAQAIQHIILRRDMHIDSLLERLKEERVRKVIEAVIIGDLESLDTQSDDYLYCKDLGLIRNTGGQISLTDDSTCQMPVHTLNLGEL